MYQGLWSALSRGLFPFPYGRACISVCACREAPRARGSRSTAREVAVARTVTPTELFAEIENGHVPFILDVRNPDEFANWQVEGSRPVDTRNLPGLARARRRRRAGHDTARQRRADLRPRQRQRADRRHARRAGQAHPQPRRWHGRPGPSSSSRARCPACPRGWSAGRSSDPPRPACPTSSASPATAASSSTRPGSPTPTSSWPPSTA